MSEVALRARVLQLEVALQTFARVAADYTGRVNTTVLLSSARGSITVGDLWRAKAASLVDSTACARRSDGV